MSELSNMRETANALGAEAMGLRTRVKELEAQKDGAYTERNALVCALSKLFPSWLEQHPEGDEWDDDWRTIVFIDGPTRQLSWHLHDSDVAAFNHLEARDTHSWDGHTTEAKYERLAAVEPLVIALKRIESRNQDDRVDDIVIHALAPYRDPDPSAHLPTKENPTP